MSKDDMETNSMNVMFDGSDDSDNTDCDEEFEVRSNKDDNNTIYRFARYINSR